MPMECSSVALRYFIKFSTIHGVLRNHTLPLALFLLTRKTEAINAHASTELKDINPCLSPAVITVGITGFETASINAFSKVFPGIKPKGCFPLRTGKLQKTTESWLDNTVRKRRRLSEKQPNAVSLAIIPPDVYLGFEKVIKEGQENLMPYFEYFEATWLGSSGTYGRPSTPLLHDGLWNQYDAAVDGGQKINNAVEAFESRMGFSHPTILKF